MAHQPDRYSPALRQIAVINVKKTGGGSTSKWQELVEAYERNEAALWAEINALDPHVVVGGNVLWLFREQLGLVPQGLP